MTFLTVTKIVDGDDGGMKILFGNCSEIASKSIPEQFPNKAKKDPLGVT